MAEKNKKQIGEMLQMKLDAVFSEIGKLTLVQRLLIPIVTFLLIGGVYYYFVFAPKHETLQAVRTELTTQKNKLSNYKIKAKSLAKFEKRMKEAQEKFNIAMKALPDKKELPSLLTEISKAGSNAGLEFFLFQPATAVNKEFYKEIPISMTVDGRYHQVADFFFQVAGLNRIVNIQDVSIAAATKNQGQMGAIRMKCSAVTYMFSEQSDEDDKGKKNKKRKKKKR